VDTFFVEMFLIFILPSLAAFLAMGSAAKKLGWYFGTAALAFGADTFIGAGFLAQARLHGTPPNIGSETLAEWFGMLIADILMIVIAANSGKKCPACLSRIHPKATRCPKCQIEIPTLPPS
jgi:hypothetical protein